MISIPPVALFLSWLAVFIVGAIAMYQYLLFLAKKGVRSTFEPGCEACEQKAALYVNTEAECGSCIARKSQEEMERYQREHEQAIKRINLNTERELAKLQRRRDEDAARVRHEEQLATIEMERAEIELDRQRLEDKLEEIECHDEH